MKRRDSNTLRILRILVLIFLVGSIFGFSLQGKAEDPQFFVKEETPTKAPLFHYVPDEVIVKFKGDIAEESISGLLSTQHVSEKLKNETAGFSVLRVPGGKTVQELVEVFKASPLVEYAEPNYYVYADWSPDDSLYSYQWHFHGPENGGIQMEDAWGITTGNPDVIVAVIDSGVAYEERAGPGFWHLDTYNACGGSGSSWWCGVNTALPSWTALYGSYPTPPGYGNGWKQYLQHAFDLNSANGTVIFSYHYRYDIETGNDYFYVDVSDDGGGNWATVKTYTGTSNSTPTNNWKTETLDLTSHAGGDIIVRFRFNSNRENSDEDSGFNSDGAVYIDEVSLDDDSGNLFYDDMESGVGAWETTRYQRAPDLNAATFTAGYDFVNNDSYPNDDNGHGTHVTGTIAQATNNDFGVAGIAFNTTVMPVKVLNARGTGTYTMIASGIYYATNHGAKIINLSLGGKNPSVTLKNALAYAYNHGVTIFAAAGNDDTKPIGYPAAYDAYCIAVGATQYDTTRAPYSRYGPSLDIVAPGGNIGVDQSYDGYPDGVLQMTFGNTPVDWGYWFYEGTSMSTPHASGVAALLLAQNPGLTPDQIRYILESTAIDLGSTGRDDDYGYGLINAPAALGGEPPPPPIVSISLLTDGTIELGRVALGYTADNSGDIQTVKVEEGPADLTIKSTEFVDSMGHVWNLETDIGGDQVIWEFSPDGGSWYVFTDPYTEYTFANVSENATQDIYLRLTMPSDSYSEERHSALVTILATAP